MTARLSLIRRMGENRLTIISRTLKRACGRFANAGGKTMFTTRPPADNVLYSVSGGCQCHPARCRSRRVPALQAFLKRLLLVINRNEFRRIPLAPFACRNCAYAFAPADGQVLPMRFQRHPRRHASTRSPVEGVRGGSASGKPLCNSAQIATASCAGRFSGRGTTSI